jgi:D-inositol-3-phosphate glycosyltransferase
MKILFVCENYLPHYGGAEVVFKNLAEGFVKKGHSVELITRRLKETSKTETIGGVKIHRVKSLNSRYWFSLFAIPKVISLARQADIVQTTTFNGAPPAWLGARLTRTPVALTVHEIWIGKWQKVTTMSWLSCKIHDTLERMLYLLSFDKYCCVSESTKKDVIAYGITPEKVAAIHNGMDYTFWDKSKYTGKKIRPLLATKEQFLCFAWGRPGPSKGFEYAIPAMKYLKKSLPNARMVLMISSKDKYPTQYSKLLKLANKEEHVALIDPVAYEKLPEYLAAADCIIVPSIAEGFGYTTVEGNTMGKPVVASNIMSIPEVISGHHVLVEPRNSKAIADGVISIAKGKGKKTTLKKFSWPSSIKKYLDVYSSLILRQ